jgi:UDP-2,3-diacylglucosamine pyrophosphatase LpxH
VRAIVVSDLHLGATGTVTDDAFVSFLEWLAERAHSDTDSWRLILLGDLLDLQHCPRGVREPLAALDAVAAQHRSVLAALGAAAERRIAIDLIPGNHDSELVDPHLQERLRALVADAAGTSAAVLRSTLRVRPWFLLVPGLLYAEHGSQYHALNAVADPLAPFGRWSGCLPPGGVLDLFVGRREQGGRARALSQLAPAMLSALARRGRTDAAAVASLHPYAQETGLSPDALRALRGLAEDSSLALLRNALAAMLGRGGYVEARQQQAAVAVHQILGREEKAVPVYVFGHTHRVAQRALDADGAKLLWFNGGAWAGGSYGFVEVEGRADGVVARLSRWDPVARSTLASSDPILAPPSISQEDAPMTRIRSAGNSSTDPVATP